MPSYATEAFLPGPYTAARRLCAENMRRRACALPEAYAAGLPTALCVSYLNKILWCGQGWFAQNMDFAADLIAQKLGLVSVQNGKENDVLPEKA